MYRTVKIFSITRYMEQSHNNIVKNLVGSQVREKYIEMPKNPSTSLFLYVWTMTHQRC